MNLLKRLRNLLFDYRSVEWSRQEFEAWLTWSPHFGFNLDFHIEFVLPHKADPDDPLDSSWGPEVKFNLTLLWIGIGLNVPNDDWCDDDCTLEVPKHYCPECGVESEYMVGERCTGCRLTVELCTCTQAEYGAHEVGFDGCPSCFGCDQCDYDCCSDCTFDKETEITGDYSEGTINTRYWNEVCNCEGHYCRTKAQPNAGASGFLLGSDVKLVRLDSAGRPVPIDTAEMGE